MRENGIGQTVVIFNDTSVDEIKFPARWGSDRHIGTKMITAFYFISSSLHQKRVACRLLRFDWFYQHGLHEQGY